MVNKALMQAIKNETKTLQQQGFDKIEKQFIKDNWEMFSESKFAVNGAFRDPSVTNGTEMLTALGIQGVTIHKVKTDDVVKMALDRSRDRVWDLFMKDIAEKQSVTAFFVISTTAMVMSNARVLTVPGKFQHKLESQGKLGDIYWAWAKDLKGGLTLY